MPPTIDMRPVRDRQDAERFLRFGALLWNLDPDVYAEYCAPDYIALAQADNYVFQGYVDGELSTIALGFFGRHDKHFVLHSHFVYVAPGLRDQGLGFAVKQHQRQWALERDVDTIMWTYDPLVRRNSHINLTKLGASVVQYKINVYGQLTSSQNQNDESDRFLVAWHLNDSPQSQPPADGDVVLQPGDHDWPVRTPSGSPTWKAQIPEDIALLRSQYPDVARQWRLAFRQLMNDAETQGYRVTGITRDGWYTLRSSHT